jgi:uncharacterized BrkB/YihY/UPF0761 family membrane protein
MAGAPDPRQSKPAELEVESTIAGRFAGCVGHFRILQYRAERARARHASVDLSLILVERDSSIGGGLLAGALAYRLFVLLLPTSLLLVSGLGLYAGAVDESPMDVARRAWLHGLIGTEVAQTAGGHARWLIFVVMIPAVVYALSALYRALAKIYAIIWLGSGRGVRVAPVGVAVLGAAGGVQLATWEITRRVREGSEFGGVAAFVVYVLLIGGAWFVVSLWLPRGTARWPSLLPGAALFGVGFLLVTIFNIYVTTWIVQGRENTYGALGIAAALLFSLVLVGRLMVVSAELNASLSERRVRRPPPQEES